MSVAPIIAIACGFVGCVSGAASGARHSFLWGVAGGGLGFVLGIVSFFALVFPYVGWLVQYEKRHPTAAMNGPPRLWAYLFLPLMFATVILAALVPWFAIGLLL
jgi:hypothetical protein